MTGEPRPGVLVCVAVEGRFLQGDTVRELREQAFSAEASGAAAVFVSPSALGDPVVLAAGLSTAVPEAKLGVRLEFGRDGRHPAMLARDLTGLDLVSGGRSVLCFEPPFGDELAEAIALCRAMWHEGVVASEGPLFPGVRSRHPGETAERGEPAGRARPHSRRRSTTVIARPGRPSPSPDARPVDLHIGAGVTDTAIVRGRHEAVTPTTAVTGRHLPALNGLRGVAVIGVVAYHLQLGWASGGYLGVDLFFVLSGFLITSLLLEEWTGSGRISLVSFWGRRAKRLLPALFLVVIALGLYIIANALFGGPGANGLLDLHDLRWEAIWSLLYANNWHLIYAPPVILRTVLDPIALAAHVVPGDRRAVLSGLAPRAPAFVPFRPPGLAHARHRRDDLARPLSSPRRPHGRPVPPRDGSVTGLLRDRHPPLRSHGRRHLGLPGGVTPPARPRARRTLHVVAPVAAAVLAVFWVTAGVTSGTAAGFPKNFMFEGGFLICAALAALVIADARLIEPGRFSRALAWPPLHFIGTISYGIYLWHWPVIVYLTAARTGLPTVSLDLVRILVTLALSTASYYLVERPIRLARPGGVVRWWGAPLAGILSAVLIVVATTPAVADPSKVVGTTHLVSTSANGRRPRSRRIRRAEADPAWRWRRRRRTRSGSCSWAIR